MPHYSHQSRPTLQRHRRQSSRIAPSASIDPNFVHHLPTLDLHTATIFLAQAADVVGGGVAKAGEAAVEAKKIGLWDTFVNSIEWSIRSLHDVLANAGVKQAYGYSIILFTVAIKALTFPLNAKQMDSTMKMQSLTPRVKQIQADYKDNPQVMNQMISRLYQEENVNPLAGCLPVLAQFPIWIGLYRSVLNLASDNILNESFLWIPSLQGPVSKTGQGLNTWLYPLIDGAPPVGWHDAAAYLVIPVLLIIVQIYSQKLLQPPNQDPAAAKANKFLKFLPVLFGYFALNVPSGLCVYWLTNSLLSTAQTVVIRQKYATAGGPTLSSNSTDAGVDEDTTTSLKSASMREVDGFTSAESNGDAGLKKTTAGARKITKKKRKKRRK